MTYFPWFNACRYFCIYVPVANNIEFELIINMFKFQISLKASTQHLQRQRYPYENNLRVHRTQPLSLPPCSLKPGPSLSLILQLSWSFQTIKYAYIHNHIRLYIYNYIICEYLRFLIICTCAIGKTIVSMQQLDYYEILYFVPCLTSFQVSKSEVFSFSRTQFIGYLNDSI